MEDTATLYHRFGDHIALGGLGREATAELMRGHGVTPPGRVTLDRLVRRVRTDGGPTQPYQRAHSNHTARAYVARVCQRDAVGEACAQPPTDARRPSPARPPAPPPTQQPAAAEPGRDGFSASYKGGEAEFQYRGGTPIWKGGGDPHSEASLMREFAIDLDVWEPVAIDYKSNQQAQKGPDGNPVVVPYYQAAVRTRRRLIEASAPVTITPMPRKPREAEVAVERCLVIPDTQIGFRWRDGHTVLDPMHDRVAMDAVWQVAQAGDFDVIVLLGDMLDFAPMSTKYARDPNVEQTTTPSIREFAWWLAQLRAAAPSARIVYLEGNHERRLRSLMVERAPELVGVVDGHGSPVVSVASWLGLSSLDIEYVAPYGERWHWHDVTFTHGEVVKRKGGQTAAAMGERYARSTFQGHVHRVEHGMRTWYDNAHGEPRMAHYISPGSLCRIRESGPPGVDVYQDWQQGFAVASRVNERTHCEVHAVLGGDLVFDGRVFRGEDRRAEIAEAVDVPQIAGLRAGGSAR